MNQEAIQQNLTNRLLMLMPNDMSEWSRTTDLIVVEK